MKKVVCVSLVIFLGLTTQIVAQGEGSNEKEPAKPKSKLDYKFGGLLQIWGLYSQEYSNYAPNRQGDASNNFKVRRAELAVVAKIPKKLDFVVMSDLSRYPGSFNTENDRAALPLQDAFMEYHLPYLDVRAGQFLIPLTWESDHPAGDLHFMERAIVSGGGSLTGAPAQTIGYGDKRDLGLMLGYNFKRNKKKFFKYNIALLQGFSQNIDERDEDKLIAGKVEVNPWGRIFTVGASGMKDTTGSDAARNDRVGGHMVLKVAAATAVFEFMQGWDGAYVGQGFYGSFLYNLKSVIGFPMEPGIKFEQFSRDLDRNGKAVRIYTGGFNFYLFKNQAKLQINYLYVDDDLSVIPSDHQIGINTQVGF